ncbi:MAG: Hsp20/alpha crystallin family protein [Pyrinomonadaceae bacterium]
MAQRWDPIRDLVLLQERMNRLFEDSVESNARGNGDAKEQEIERADWSPAADVYETESAYVIALDLPGIDRAALDISMMEDQIVMRGARATEGEATQRQRRIERPQGRFLRKFGVPVNINREAIAADYKDGVLRVTLPKRAERNAGRVEIKVS